jgi:hypothetical protein
MTLLTLRIRGGGTLWGDARVAALQCASAASRPLQKTLNRNGTHCACRSFTARQSASRALKP